MLTRFGFQLLVVHLDSIKPHGAVPGVKPSLPQLSATFCIPRKDRVRRKHKQTDLFWTSELLLA